MITITHRLPYAAHISQGSAWHPWSLSLLAAQDPPDDTNYWILSFRAYHFHTRVVEAYPPQRWDRHSSQFRGVVVPQKYYRQDKFRVLEGVFGLKIESDDLHGGTRRLNVCLLLGRQADSRRETPAPWCRLVLDGEKRDLVRLYSVYESTADFGTSSRVSYTREPSEHSLELGEGHSLKTSVSAKEISGVMYYVVRLEPLRIGWLNRGLFLVRGHGP